MARQEQEQIEKPPVWQRWRNAASAPVLFSAAVHVAVALLMSLIVLTSQLESTPLIASLTEPIDPGEQLVTALPEIEPPDVVPVDTEILNASSAVSAGLNAPLVDLPEMATNTETAATNIPGPADNEADAGNNAVRTMIQSRVQQAGGKKGEVQFSLAWPNRNDVDLHVIAPSGERISFRNRKSLCRGALDVDMNVKGESDEPVENVRWLSRQAPAGRYTVLVNLFRTHGNFGLTECQLLANLGRESKVVFTHVHFQQRVVVYHFKYIPQTIPADRRARLLADLDRVQAREEKQASSMLAKLQDVPAGANKDRALQKIVANFPHTDAAIEALKLMSVKLTK